MVTGPPTATPVTGTVTLVVPAAKVTVVGTVATAVLLEFRLTVKPPAGADPERFSARFCVAPWAIVALVGEKLIVSVGLEVPTITC